MSARAKMTMRAAVQRKVGGSDQWGSDGVPRFQDIGDVPCLVSGSAKRELTDPGKSAVIEDIRATMPIGSDVRQGDRISRITNRLGAELYAGPLAVETIIRRKGHSSRGSHLELMLARHK